MCGIFSFAKSSFVCWYLQETFLLTLFSWCEYPLNEFILRYLILQEGRGALKYYNGLRLIQICSEWKWNCTQMLAITGSSYDNPVHLLTRSRTNYPLFFFNIYLINIHNNYPQYYYNSKKVFSYSEVQCLI